MDIRISAYGLVLSQEEINAIEEDLFTVLVKDKTDKTAVDLVFKELENECPALYNFYRVVSSNKQ